MYDPERYETNKTAPGQDAAEFTPKIIDLMTWKENELILDYGCGAGSVCHKYFVPMALTHGSNVDAVDISEEMIRYAKANHTHPLVQYHVGNILADDFPLRRNVYDRIISIYVLHFIKDFKRAFQRFFDILKPGGQLGFTTLGRSRLCKFLQSLGQNPKWSSYFIGYEAYITTWDEEEKDAEELLRTALIETGFKISEMKTVERNQEFGADATIDLFMSLNPFLKKIPVDLLPALKEEYKAIVVRGTSPQFAYSNTDKILLNYDLVYCVASKAD